MLCVIISEIRRVLFILTGRVQLYGERDALLSTGRLVSRLLF